MAIHNHIQSFTLLASPICREEQSERAFPIFAFSSQFFLFFPDFFRMKLNLVTNFATFGDLVLCALNSVYRKTLFFNLINSVYRKTEFIEKHCFSKNKVYRVKNIVYRKNSVYRIEKHCLSAKNIVFR